MIICPDHCSDLDSCSRKFCLRDLTTQMPYVLCDNQGLKDSVAQMPYIPCDNQLPISSSSPRQDTELQFVHILRWVIFFGTSCLSKQPDPCFQIPILSFLGSPPQIFLLIGSKILFNFQFIFPNSRLWQYH